MRSWKLLLPLLASTLCFAQQPDRIAGPINSSQMVALTGNVHGFAQPRFDLGRTDSGRVLYGVTLAFRPSAAQKADLNNLLAQQQDRSSPNYHKWLTPAEFADRFGMTRNDVNRVVAWLEAQGFTVTSIANSRNQISFEGTVAQVETVFRTEIHNYLVDGEIHFANATNPSVPAALAGLVPAVGHLHNFSPKPPAQFRTRSLTGAQPHFTTPFVTSTGEDHFLAPGDFATIYNLPPGLDGTNQTIAVVGQSTVSANDLANFRVAAGLAAKAPQYILYPSTSTGTRCPGDEGESDLDLEWSGGVAANANIIFVYAGLLPGESCGENRTYSVWDALQQTVDNNYAPIISTSYGACEAINGETFAVDFVQAWAREANAQGQTIMAASGDAGAADCDATNSPSATGGLAVDVPASIPEVTGMGGTEFDGDAEATVTNGNANTTTYWKGTTGGISTLSSALSYIPEMGWNDTVENDGLLASGGGASIYFPKTEAPWQTGTGVPNDGARDVPDLALNASPYHDPYLICSEDGQASPCTNGFVSESGEILLAGGTSCAAPTFSAIVALLNQSLGSSGLGNINPTLYSLAASNPAAFHDVTTGNNIVPCTKDTTGCPATAPFQYGFSAGAGYDQVTGLGSVNANTLFTAWAGSRTASSITITSPPTGTNVTVGTSVSFKVAVTPASGVGAVSFSTLNNGTATPLGTVTLNVPYPSTTTGTATFATSALPGGTNSVRATYEGDTADKAATSAPTVVTVTVPFTVSPAPSSRSVSAGQTATYAININPTSGFTGTVSFTNSTTSSPGSCNVGLPAGTLCSFSPGNVALDGVPADTKTVTLTITTAANMALPSGAQAITVTGTSGSTAIPTTVDLTVTATTESFTLTTQNNATTFPVTVGATEPVSVNVTSTTGFVNNNTTVLPLTYTCTGSPSLSAAEISCQISPGGTQPTNAAAVSVNLGTIGPTSQLRRPFGGGIFYALLLPGLFGIVFAAGSRTRGLRLLGMIVVLGFSTLWLGACGGSGGGGTTTPPNPGSTPGTYTVTVKATTGGANPVTSSLVFTLNVTP
jgi:subtilase family serine protease